MEIIPVPAHTYEEAYAQYSAYQTQLSKLQEPVIYIESTEKPRVKTIGSIKNLI